MNVTAWVGLAGAVAVAIFFLLWRLEAARRATAEMQRDFANSRVETLLAILDEERKLRDLAGEARARAEKRIDEIRKGLVNAKPGDEIADIFGTGLKDGKRVG